MDVKPIDLLTQIEKLKTMIQSVSQQGRREQCLNLLIQLRRQLFTLGG
jgi:hypothetical protein